MEYEKDLLYILRQVAHDGVIECPNCGNLLEPDSPECVKCEWINPIYAYGLI